MASEQVTVRMSRSDPSIPWAFSFSSRGGDVIVGSVTSGGLASKAGLQTGDVLSSIDGRTRPSLADANRALEQRRLDLDLHLQRYVTRHSLLPWSLTEQDNKLVVDHIPSQLNLPGSRSWESSAISKSDWKRDSQSNIGGGSGAYDSNSTSYNNQYNSTTFGNKFGGSSAFGNQAGGTHTPYFSNTTSGTGNNSDVIGYGNQGGYGRQGAGIGNQFNGGLGNQSGGGLDGSHSGGGYNFGSGSQSGGGYGSNFSGGYGSRPGGGYSNGTSHIGKTQPIAIQTHHDQYGSSPRDARDRVFYHSPQPRSGNQLSPDASVRHLQYNSPMNLYSSDAANEQFCLQTGQPVHPTAGRPKYLSSETRRLIEENERGLRGVSPSAQSPALLRIGHAVGADY